MWETTTLMISYNTPLEILDTLKSRIKQYVLENNREWSGFDLNIDKMEYQNAIHVVVAMERTFFPLVVRISVWSDDGAG